jgi:hypothetical protein
MYTHLTDDSCDLNRIGLDEFVRGAIVVAGVVCLAVVEELVDFCVETEGVAVAAASFPWLGSVVRADNLPAAPET